MKQLNLLDCNPLLSDRVRLAIMVKLTLTKEYIDFSTLLESLELTKGNLSTHISKLEEAQLIEVKKEFIAKKPRTSYCSTLKGTQAVEQYLKTIESLLKQLK